MITGAQVHLKTVNDKPPVGLCGSGLIDLVAQLRRADILDARGAFCPHPRVRGNCFLVVQDGREITLSRADIAEIQLAKAAIRAGMRLLLRQAGLTEADLTEVILAGAFGSYLNVSNAITIGLLPRLAPERIRQIGNAAGAGARLALLSTGARTAAAQLAQRIEYVELARAPEFQREFAQALRLE
jgi:uncharacterized 2Fe-2S/4Fe-4S cluster protein (DUF4445 family)